MSIMDKTLNRLSISELRHGREKEINMDIIDEIFRNPIIRDLPKFASLYGLYSTFIVGQEDIFFVFGFNKELIHHGSFVEAEGTLYPEEELKKVGYMHVPYLFSRDWNVMKINDPREIYDYLPAKLETLEMFKTRYAKYGMKMPPYVYASEIEMFEMRKYKAVTDNLTVKDESKRIYEAREKVMLDDIAVWEWPITATSKKPGIIAFVSLSRYYHETTNMSATRKQYNHPETWDELYRKHKGQEVAFPIALTPEAAKYVLGELDKRGIPYTYPRRDNRVHADIMAEATMINRIVYNNDSAPDENVEVYFHIHDEGIVRYLMNEYVKKQFSQSEITYGNYMFQSSAAARLYQEGDNAPMATYLFYVPDQFLSTFREATGKMNIKFGYPSIAGCNNCYRHLGAYLITDFKNMAAVDSIVQSFYGTMFSMHSVSMMEDSDDELRTFSPYGAVYSHRKPWHYEKGTFKISHGITEDGEITEGKSDKLFSCKLLTESPSCYPLDYYRKKGMYVDNDPKKK